LHLFKIVEQHVCFAKAREYVVAGKETLKITISSFKVLQIFPQFTCIFAKRQVKSLMWAIFMTLLSYL